MILFEDDSYSAFSPLVEYRPLSFLKVGGFSLYEYLGFFLKEKKILLSDRNEIQTKYSADYPFLTPAMIGNKSFLNSVVLPEKENLKKIFKFIKSEKKEYALFSEDKKTLIFFNTSGSFENFTYRELFIKARGLKNKKFLKDVVVLKNIFDIIKYSRRLLKEHVVDVVKNKKLKIAKNRIYSADKKTFSPQVELDISAGSIYIEKNVYLEPWVFLKGPLWISAGARVKSYSRIENSFLGREVRVGGEVSNSIIYDFSNKNHHGYLGDSLVGSWVNVGAGATSSNLKNTYGEIRVNLMKGGEIINTQEQFIGVILGDFSKIGINTSLFTGKMVGWGSSVLGKVDKNISHLIFQKGINKIQKWELNSFLKMVKRMFLRRNITFTELERNLLLTLYKKLQ